MKKTYLTILSLLILLVLPAQISAQIKPETQTHNFLKSFKQYYDFAPINSTTPVVAEVPISDTSLSFQSTFALLEIETNSQQAWERRIRQKTTPYKILNATQNDLQEINLYDKNQTTFKEFPAANENTQSTVILRIEYEKPITSGAINLQLASYATPPESIALKTTDNNTQSIVISEKPYTPSGLRFPARTASIWELTLKHTQPLRVNEISLLEQTQIRAQENYIRFLIKPGHTYRLFANPDTRVSLPYIEKGSLSYAQNTVTLHLPSPQNNPLYQPADDDQDSIPNINDNCPSLANPAQTDVNNNRKGDDCEDFDFDGVMNNSDNCPDQPNRYQQDNDEDNIGDACDEEESRLTERLAFLPWAGIILGFAVVIILFILTTKKSPSNPETKTSEK